MLIDPDLQLSQNPSILFEGIQNFRMSTVVDGIPLLLHAAVFLFLAGLVDVLFSINDTVAHVVLGIVILCAALYITITILPVIRVQCPFRTPLSSICWHMRYMLSPFQFHTLCSHYCESLSL